MAVTGAASAASSISDDGRYVAFISNAQNFGVPGSGFGQVWVRDRVAGTVQLVSRAADGAPANSDCRQAIISGNGRYVAWQSYATNLVSEVGWYGQVYVRDLQGNTTEMASLASDETPGNSLSGYNLAISKDGRYVAFSSYASNLAPGDANGVNDIYLRDRQLGTCERISVGLGSAEPNSDSGLYGLSVNADGRYVVFNSTASNLVSGDTNAAYDTFVRDRVGQTTERVSVTTGGEQANGESRSADVSDDGRYVVFQSFAANMLPDTAWSPFGIYLRDRTTGSTELITRNMDQDAAFGSFSAPGISADGRYVVFGADSYNLVAGDTNPGYDYFVRDRVLGTNRRVSLSSAGVPGEGDSFTYDTPGVSQNGQVASFSSLASNLVTGDTNGRVDVFVRDQDATTTVRVSVGPDGEQGIAPASSNDVAVNANGRYVAFISDAINLVPNDTNGTDDAFLVDRTTGNCERVNLSSAGAEGDREGAPYYSLPGRPGVSADGRFVAFWSTSSNLVPNDTNGQPDVFVRDRKNGTTERISITTDGSQAYADYGFNDVAISDDGRYVAFVSGSSNLVANDHNGATDIFIRDRLLGLTERISAAPDGGVPFPSIDLNSGIALSGNGRCVAFVSEVNTLVPGDTNNMVDVFVHDRSAGATERVSVNSSGQQSNGASYAPTLSQDGRFVAFVSYGSNLSAGAPGDVYVHDRVLRTTQRASGTVSETQYYFAYPQPSVSSDGRYVLFVTDDAFLVADDDNPHADLFLRDRQLLDTELLSRTSDGTIANGWGIRSAGMSADARVAAFSSSATNLAVNLAPGGENVFVRERAAGLPFAPVNLTAATLNRTSIALAWHDQSSNEAGFRIERNGGAGFVSLVTLPAGSESYVDSGLIPATTYTYRVIAFHASGECGATNEASATTMMAELPTPPSSLLVMALSSTSVRLNWLDESDNETGFAVVRRQGSGSFTDLSNLPSGSTEFVDTGLTPTTVYTYRVRAFNLDGNSDYAEGSALTPPFAPSAPTSFTASPASQTLVQLTWTDTSDNEQGFTIERGVGDGPVSSLTSVGTNTVAYSDGSAAANTTYHYVLRAYNTGGSSAVAEATVTTPPNSPAVPSALTANVRSLTSIRLTWHDNSTNETGFLVERRAGASNFSVVETVGAGSTGYLDTTTVAGITYHYRVTALNAGGTSAPSNEVEIVIQAAGKLSIAPGRLNFGVVRRGKSKQLKLTVKNVGKVALSGEIGPLAAPYRIVTGGSIFSLERGKSRVVTVEFAPEAAGLATGELPVASTAGTEAERTVEITGRGK